MDIVTSQGVDSKTVGESYCCGEVHTSGEAIPRSLIKDELIGTIVTAHTIKHTAKRPATPPDRDYSLINM